MLESQNLTLEGSQIDVTGDNTSEEITKRSGKRKRNPTQRSHPNNCNCKYIPETDYDIFRASWKKAKTIAEKSSLISTLIGKRFHGPKRDSVEYEFNKLYISRDCLAIKLGIGERTLTKYSKQKIYADNRGRHKNRKHALILAIKKSHTTHQQKNLKMPIFIYIMDQAHTKLPDKQFPSFSWFKKWFRKNYKKYRFKKLRTDVCNVCDYLRVKINNSTGSEKEKNLQILAIHQEDANGEYKWEAGI